MTLPTYLSGERIQGTSTDSLPVTTVQGTDNPSLDFDFSSQPTGWNYRIVGSTSHWDNDSSRLNWETKAAGSGSGADYDLGVAQTENWVLRFKFRIDDSQTGMTSAGQGDGVVIFGLQNYPSTAAYTASTPNSQNDSTYAEDHQTAQFQLCIKSNLSQGSGKYKFQGRAEVTNSANQATSQINEELSGDTDYWIEVRRTSATTFTLKGFTNANYSSNQVGSTATFTVSSGALDGLRYIHFEGHAQNVNYDSYGGGILTDLEFWGTTAVAKDKSTITDVPLGTRYEETDTRKIFRRATDLISGTDLKAYWKFSESSGNIANVASTVEGNSTMDASDTALVATGSPTYSQSSSNPSNLGNSVLFDGSDDVVQASTGSNTLSQFNFLHDGSTPYTISFWAKFPSGAGDSKTLFDNFRGFDDLKGMWICTSPQEHWRFEISNTGGNSHVIKTDGNPQLEIPTDNAWHFYCFRWNYSLGSDNLIYSVDNATSGQYFESEDKIGSASTGNSELDLCIGARSNETAHINLYLAEFSIFHRILTAAEVTKLYNSGAGFQLDTGLPLWVEKGTA